MEKYLSNKECIIFESSLALNCEQKLKFIMLESYLVTSSTMLEIYFCTVWQEILTNIQCDSRKDKYEHNIN